LYLISIPLVMPGCSSKLCGFLSGETAYFNCHGDAQLLRVLKYVFDGYDLLTFFPYIINPELTE